MTITAQNNGWILETRQTAYALGLTAGGLLVNRYWGARLPYDDDYPLATEPRAWGPFNSAAQAAPEEFPGYDDMKYVEVCLKVTFADGVRDVALRFDAAEVDGDTLRIHLRDAHYPLLLTLRYRVHEAYDLIERSAALVNEGTDAIMIERMLSAQWHLPIGNHYCLTYLSGRWFDEMHIIREALQPGVKRLESRRLTSSHHHQPYFAVDRGNASEEQGEVWFGLLEWSGNWMIAAEVTQFFSTRISIGLNDWDFAWRLNGGETFETPPSFAGYSNAGFGAASRALHDFVRETVLPHGVAPHKVYYDSWEATLFDVNHESQARLAETAAALGCEMFMIDDGWYHDRFTQDSGQGDWYPDPKKFPQGLHKLIEHVNDLGMEFGLWVEPEMVNPDSDLYRAHPDWVIHFPTRERRLGRSSLILNLGREDVQDYLIDSLDRLLSSYKIDYVDWDMNRNVSEPGWGENPPGDARELWVRYVRGMYRIWETVRARHPKVIWQSCSGGGGRIDLGMLRLSDMIWISDNSGAAARLEIQRGYSLMFPATTMQAWVTDQSANLPLTFRCHAAMCGLFGIGADITKWSDAEREIIRDQIATYKTIRHIIQNGDLYRLETSTRGFSAVLYLSKDKREGVLFAFRTHIAQHEPSLTLRLCGLTPDVRYRVEGFEGVRSGSGWMQSDLQFGIYGGLADFESKIVRIRHFD